MGQRVDMFGGHHVEALTGGDHQQFQRAQGAGAAQFFGHQLDGLVDPPGPFHVHCQGVEKDVGQGVAGDLSDGRVAVVDGYQGLQRVWVRNLSSCGMGEKNLILKNYLEEN